MGGQESKLQDRKLEEKCGVIASIDFGTKYTGYAYIFRDKTSFPDVYKPQLADMKREQTCIMLKKAEDGTFEFESFGNTAMETFTKLETQEMDSVFFFRLFKTNMDIENQSLVLTDQKKRKVNAEIVFTKVYEFVQADVIKFLNKSLKGGQRITEEDILWVITIPAIWGYKNRYFIRKCAEKSYHNIKIVLEPEAASMYIRNKPTCFTECKVKQIEPLKPGQCYILVDMGAGTSDICAHKIQSDGNLIEICSTSGVGSGGEQINNAFFDVLDELFTSDVMNKYRMDTMRFLKLEKDFEDIKHKFKSDMNTAVVFLLDEKLLNLFRTTGQDFGMCLKQSKFSEKLEFRNNDRLYMNKNFMAFLFDRTVSTITSMIQEQILKSKRAGHDISCILLSGGLSESDYVYDSILRSFTGSSNEGERIPVVLAPNAHSAVVEGALQLGLNPKGIVARVSPYTYGFYSIVPFQEGAHPEDLKDYHEGAAVCKAVFYKLIEKNQIVRPRDTFIRKSTTVYSESKHQTRITSLWRSFKKDPQYCTPADQCELVAKYEITPPPEGWPKVLPHVQRLILTDNEFELEFVNETTGKKYTSRVEYDF